jgi:hypothetical protein
MEMRRAILRHQGRDGNIVAEEEVVIIMTMTITKDLHVLVAEVHGGVKAEVGSVMKKGILKQPGKVGNIVAAEETAITMKMTTMKGLHVAKAEEAGIMMTTKTITEDLHVANAEEAGIMMMMKTIIKDLHGVVADGAVVMKKTMTIINDLQVVAEVRAVAREEVGMEMRKVIRKQLWKAGSIGAEEEGAAMTMTTIISNRHVVGAEVHAMGKAEVGLAMKEDIPAQPGKVGAIEINFLDWIFEKVH